jgi:DNA-binding HxlR family transcriptional regulator
LTLATLFHRRWMVPVIAALQRWRGSKFITLVNRLEVSRPALRKTLDEAIERGWIRHNPGYGHPLRPEYLLAGVPPDPAPSHPDRINLGPPCARLMTHLDRLDIADAALRKWSMPALHAMGREAMRFADLRRRLEGITDRALTLALKDLIEAGLAQREVYDEFPPTTLYRITRPARALLEPLQDMLPGQA